jgi:hypothetical protein|tara:strand:- start:281 stop:568 length:288 start_codon:yes stop_codon:yes gene_type:complete
MSEMEKNNHPSSKQMNDAIHQRLLQLQKPCMSNSELSDDSDCIDPMEICYPANERCLSSGEQGRAGEELHCWEQLLPAAPESGSKMIYIQQKDLY